MSFLLPQNDVMFVCSKHRSRRRGGKGNLHVAFFFPEESFFMVARCECGRETLH